VLHRSATAIAILLLCAPSAHAGTQLFDGSWTVKAFGNERTGGTGESEFYSAFGLPQGIQCNPHQPRCNFSETPTDGSGNFAPLGGSQRSALFCGTFSGPRPAKGMTLTTGGKNYKLIAPLYRNPAFFTAGGAPNLTSCTATTTGATPGGKGRVQAGKPITGKALASTTGTGRGGFQFPAAPDSGAIGIRGTRVGEFGALYPYLYSYTYATLRNDAGFFGPGDGPGSFSIPYLVNGKTVARVAVKQGAAKFGGTMKMLGGLTTKVCYYAVGGCWRHYDDWRYEAIGAAAYTNSGIVTKGYQAGSYVHPSCIDGVCPSSSFFTPQIAGARFPWTTGSVTVTAVGRGPHKTVHYAKGYDNRTPTSGMGTIQLVSPTLTRWFSPAVKFETGGIGILKLKFAPEPRGWATVLAGIAALAVGYRLRRSQI